MSQTEDHKNHTISHSTHQFSQYDSELLPPSLTAPFPSAFLGLTQWGLLSIRTLTTVCLAYELVIVFGFHLTVSFQAQNTFNHWQPLMDKVMETRAKHILEFYN